MASNTFCTDAAQPLGSMAPLMKMRERPAAKSIAGRSIICRTECAAPFFACSCRSTGTTRSTSSSHCWRAATMQDDNN